MINSWTSNNVCFVCQATCQNLLACEPPATHDVKLRLARMLRLQICILIMAPMRITGRRGMLAMLRAYVYWKDSSVHFQALS